MAAPTAELDSTVFDLDPWLTAKQRFLEEISDDVERALFDTAAVENIFNGTKDASQDGRARLFVAKIQPLVDALGDFGSALDNFTNIAPAFLAPIWGSIRVVLVLAKRHQKFFDKLVDVLGRIGDILPRSVTYTI